MFTATTRETHHAPRRVAVIYNPIAGWRRRRRFRRVLDGLAAMGCPVTVFATAARGDAEAFARTLDTEAFDVVAAAGGDGTINEVANGLVDRGLPLAVIPLGTANVLAAEIGIPETPQAIARVVAEGAPRPIVLGYVNGRRFVQMAGVGFDAHVVAHVTPGLKRALGKFAYVLWSLAGLLRFPFRRYRLTVDGTTFEAASAVIANGHYYAGRYTCAPDARLEEPTLKVCLFERSGRLSVLRYGLALLLGRLHRLSDVHVVTATTIAIEGGADEPVQGDGDIVAHLPLTAGLNGATLDLIFPR
jgi:YegS/Rv2252/BmrU family lipid kinase